MCNYYKRIISSDLVIEPFVLCCCFKLCTTLEISERALQPWGWKIMVLMVVLDCVTWGLEIHSPERSCCMMWARIGQKNMNEIGNAETKKVPLISEWFGSRTYKCFYRFRSVHEFPVLSLSSDYWLFEEH